MEGWVSLHRKMIEWEWYTDQNTKSLFIHCLLKANRNPVKWRGVNIQRGQFFTSLGNLSFDLGLSMKQIRISLKKLKNTGEVAYEGASRGTMITVCNYDNYQHDIKTRGQAVGQTKGKQRASKGQQTIKSNKEDIKERQKRFKEEVELFTDKYTIDMLTAFYSYWSEPNQAKSKMKKEMQDTWDTKRRLLTWFNRSKK